MPSTIQPEQNIKTKNMTPLSLRNSINGSPLRLAFLFITLAFGCFALASAPKAFGVTPAPDGGYTGDNTAEGDNALFGLITGTSNTAIGFDALFSNTTGNNNTATGANALVLNDNGNFNTANGSAALLLNITGSSNTANGYNALYSNVIGSNNTATGRGALHNNTTANNNTANGYQALFSNTSGANNMANGFQALYTNNADNNTASGDSALVNNTTGANNTADGVNALINNTTGTKNIALGFGAGQNLTTGDNNIDIGNDGVAGESGTIRIGTVGTQTATFIAGIRGIPISGGMPVGVNSSGQLGVRPSSARYKEAIQPMDKASEAILVLKPVTFRYKKEIDADRTPEFGLVAEEVEKVNPDLVARDAKGKVFTVRYEAVNAMLLNEFLKEHRAFLKEQRKVEAQEATITHLSQDFQSKLAEQQKEIKALTSGLEKVNNQLELSKPAPRTVLNND